MNETALMDALQKHGFEISAQQLSQFQLYFETLVEWNQKMNLTSITDKDGVYLKHFYDSVTPSFMLNFSHQQRIVDVGAGAGFPSLPLKILFPHIQVAIVDSLKKRISFLEHLIDQLKLEHVQLFHARAEEFGKQKAYREQYDLVLARAVARLHTLAELCLPLAKVGGMFVAMKGSKGEEELLEGTKAIQTLGGEVNRVEQIHLPQEEGVRHIIVIDKVSKTPNKYPRKPGTPNKSPLV